jgi:hypothetical protein
LWYASAGGMKESDSSETASRQVVFHQEDLLGYILGFLDRKELLQIEVVSTTMRSCTKQYWRLLAQSLSLGEEKHSKERAVTFLRCQELAKNMEFVQDTEPSTREHMMREGQYPAYSQPELLGIFSKPTEYQFFVRISEKQEREGSTTGAFKVNWEGYLPFLLVDEPFKGVRRITCDTHEVMPELVTKLEGIDRSLNKGVCANAFLDDELLTYIKTIAMTVVAFPRKLDETAYVHGCSEPHLVTSTRCIDLVHGVHDIVDGAVLWIFCEQEVATQNDPAGIHISFKTENREISELRVELSDLFQG